MELDPTTPAGRATRRAALNYLGEALARVTTTAVDLELPLTVTIGTPPGGDGDVFARNLEAIQEASVTAAAETLKLRAVDPDIDKRIDAEVKSIWPRPIDQTADRIIMVALAFHYDHDKPNSPGEKCSCGHVYKLGRFRTEHKADSIVRALGRHGHII